jgi:hypothetical protein
VIDDDELRLQLSHAAQEFPVRGWPSDLQRRVARRRRITAGFALASVVVAVVVIVVVGPIVTRSSPGPNGTVPPASTAGAGYVGSKWRLASVAEGTHTTTIPADVDAQIDLFSDGLFLANDGVNGLDGRFTKSADGFEVYNVITSLVGYDGKDPRKLAAIAAIDTLAYGAGYPRHWSSPARDTVVSAGRTQLIIRVGAFRLTFERAGPATERN